MRLSKETKAYIGKQVYEKAQNTPQIVKAKEKLDAVEQNLRRDVEELNAMIDAEIVKLAEKYSIHASCLHNRLNADFILSRTQAEEEYEKARCAIHFADISNKTNEIIATLELGGTKADLERLLNEIKF